ncbi:hypothetical protein [Thalassolituus oleivorans]|uniref:hypothetical protein n=1 Tax=Thalassolituus oleivorans TaxID=187493 RepID=UPI0023F0A113|nr:hypothetical protein [Thalassolituus oleivorans]
MRVFFSVLFLFSFSFFSSVSSAIEACPGGYNGSTIGSFYEGSCGVASGKTDYSTVGYMCAATGAVSMGESQYSWYLESACDDGKPPTDFCTGSSCDSGPEQTCPVGSYWSDSFQSCREIGNQCTYNSDTQSYDCNQPDCISGYTAVNGQCYNTDDNGNSCTAGVYAINNDSCGGDTGGGDTGGGDNNCTLGTWNPNTQSCQSGDVGGGDTGGGDTGGGDTGGGDTGGVDTGGGDTGGGDTGGGDTGGGDSSGGGTGSGDSGELGGGDPSGSQNGSCNSSQSCQSLAAQNCQEPRDKLFFTYISGSNYFAECDTCGGTASASYSECSQCAYGYNSNTNSCYPVTCAYGDCSTPNDGNTLPDQSGDSTEVVAAIRDLQADINSGIKVTNFSVITNSLDDLSTDLQAKIGTKSDDIVDSIESLKTNLDAIAQAINDKEIGGGSGGDSGTGPDTTETNDQCVADEAGNLPSFCTKCEADANGNFPKGCSETELKKILKDILKVQQEAACLLGSTNEDNGCPAPEENTEEFDHGAAATGLYTAIQGSEFISSLTGVKDAFAGVSSSCNYNYSLYIPYANTDLDVDICGWLESIANLLRGFFIAFWAMAGIRHIFSA